MHLRAIALAWQYRCGGEQGGDIGDVLLAQQTGIDGALRGGLGDARFESVEAGAERLVECLLPTAAIPPEGAENFQSHGRILERAKVSGRLARGMVWRPVAADSSRRLVMAALLAQPANGLNRIEQKLSSVIAELLIRHALPRISFGYQASAAA